MSNSMAYFQRIGFLFKAAPNRVDGRHASQRNKGLNPRPKLWVVSERSPAKIVEGRVVHLWEEKSVPMVRVASGDLVYNVPASMLVDERKSRI